MLWTQQNQSMRQYCKVFGGVWGFQRAIILCFQLVALKEGDGGMHDQPRGLTWLGWVEGGGESAGMAPTIALATPLRGKV
jgi:hypothetical protein